MAYETDETGEKNISVRPFPNVSTARWRLSTPAGSAQYGRTMAVQLIETDRPSWRVVAQPLLTGVRRKRCWKARPYIDGPGMFDVAPDGRFLMLKVGGGDAATTTPDSLIVVQNWTKRS